MSPFEAYLLQCFQPASHTLGSGVEPEELKRAYRGMTAESTFGRTDSTLLAVSF